MRSTSEMMDLYVYYKVKASGDQAARLEPLVRAMQARLARDLGVSAQLKRRPDTRDGLQTWMEVYPGVPDRFAAQLDAAAAEAGLAELIEGPRRAEVFQEFNACA